MSSDLTLPTLTLRPQTADDALGLATWLMDLQAEWRQWDAPYLLNAAAPSFEHPDQPHERLLFYGGALIGLVTRHPEAPESGGWWELGILIFDPASWGQGLGTRALRDWTALTFIETGAHVLTLSTWSGNLRMIRTAGRVGYRECARVHEARLWQGVRYDHVQLEVLRGEWDLK